MIQATGINNNNVQLHRTYSNSKEAYQALVDKKVQDTFDNNIGKIIFLALVTLPVFFIAWPIAIGAIIGGAENQVDGKIAQERLNFIEGLSEALSKKENIEKSPEDIFKEFASDRHYKEIFNINVEPLDLIKLASVFKNEVGSISTENDAILRWKKLIKLERKVIKAINATNTFIAMQGGTKPISFDISLKDALAVRDSVYPQYLDWHGSTPTSLNTDVAHKTAKTNDEIIHRITKHHGMKLDHLNMITNFMIRLDTSNSKIIDKHAEARLKVLEILERLAKSSPSQIQNMLESSFNSKEELELLQIILGVKMVQSLNETQNREELESTITENLKDIALYPTREGKPKDSWSHENITIELPQAVLIDCSRTCYPLILTRTDTSEVLSKEEIEKICQDAQELKKKLHLVQHFDQTGMNLAKVNEMKSQKMTEASPAMVEYISPIMAFLNKIVTECEMSVSQKNSLEHLIMSAIVQETSNFTSGQLSTAVMNHPDYRLGQAYGNCTNKDAPYFIMSATESADELNSNPPISFQFNPVEKKLTIEFRVICPLATTSDYQPTPLKIQQVTQLTIDLTKEIYAPTCKICSISPQISNELVQLPTSDERIIVSNSNSD